MKKLIAILMAVLMLAVFASCGANDTEETTTETTEEVTEATAVPVDQCGMFEITAENNEGVDLNLTLGSEFAKSGSQMTITPTGYFDFCAGTWGGSGTVVNNDGVLTATYTDDQEGEEHTISITWNSEARTYLMNINDTDIVWSITADSDEDTTEATEAAVNNMYGEFTIDAENNADVDLNSVFGSQLAQTGAHMTIGEDGSFKFDAGTWGGSGTYTEKDGVLTVNYTDMQEGAEQSLTLIWNADNNTYTMNINDAAVVWSIAE